MLWSFAQFIVGWSWYELMKHVLCYFGRGDSAGCRGSSQQAILHSSLWRNSGTEVRGAGFNTLKYGAANVKGHRPLWSVSGVPCDRDGVSVDRGEGGKVTAWSSSRIPHPSPLGQGLPSGCSFRIHIYPLVSWLGEYLGVATSHAANSANTELEDNFQGNWRFNVTPTWWEY